LYTHRDCTDVYTRSLHDALPISQLGMQMNHQLSVSSGTERSRTYLSFNYYRNQGIQKYTGFQRLSLRVNSEYDVINDHLTIGEKDRKSTRLNSSHVSISYAVFCL